MQTIESNENITLSICCLTFNHEDFIAQTLDGFLLQKTNFDFEIIVHDDCSTDGTRRVIESYQEKYPNLIRPIFQSRNQYSLGLKPIFTHVFPNAKGKYIALCEGDDYWTDPLKLQKQVDFLNANEQTVLCFHASQILMPDGIYCDDFITKVPTNYRKIEDIARHGNFLHTPSIVFRNVIRQFPEMIHHTPVGDYFLQMLLATHGEFHQLPDVMAVYRYGVGVWSKEEQFTRSLRTARTHMILASYFSEIGNEAITRIFLNRVVRFLSANSAAISAENFSYLLDNCSCSNELMVALIRLLDSNNMKVKDLNQNQVQHTSSWSLMRTVVNRAIKKLPGFN